MFVYFHGLQSISFCGKIYAMHDMCDIMYTACLRQILNVVLLCEAMDFLPVFFLACRSQINEKREHHT